MAGFSMGKVYKKILITLLLLLIIAISTGISYAYYEKNNQKDMTLVLSNEILSVNYLDGKSFNLNNIMAGDVYTRKISITNVSKNSTFVTLSLMDIENSSDNLNLSVVDGNNQIVYNDNVTNVDTEIVKTVTLASGKTLNYTLMLKNNGQDNIADFFANILVYNETTKADTVNFKNTILNNNQIKNPQTQVGKEIAIADEGLIKTSDDDGEAYYFRGDVNNNYVEFGGFEWRILRINGNSSIRLISQNPIDDTYAYNSNTEMTDDYTAKLIFDNTDLKTKLNSWLSSNISDNIKYIVNTTFCNDINVYKEENEVEYLNTYDRLLLSNNPTIVCTGTKSKEQIGLITADEVVMAGAYQSTANSSYFLYNANIKNSWWTMSGSQVLVANNVIDGIAINSNGSLSFEKKINIPLLIRPVISLDKNTVVTGDGSIDNPYKIKSN
jgi:hypothetical protein